MNLVLFERERLELARGGWLPILLVSYILLGSFWFLLLGAFVSSLGGGSFGRELLLELYIAWVAAAIALVGTLTAAQSYSLERSQGTFEALLQSGLSPREIVLSKALLGLERTARVLIGCLPTSALLWVIGDIGVLPWLFAHLGLLVAAVLFVALGQVFGARSAQPGAAVIGALLAAVLTSLASAGVSSWLGALLAERFPFYPKYSPLWLPTALAEAPLDGPYLLFLCLFPLVAVALVVWLAVLLAENGLAHPLNQRTAGYRRLFVTATLAWLLLATATHFVTSLETPSDWTPIALVTLTLHFGGALVLSGEPATPTPRQRHLSPARPPRSLFEWVVIWTGLAATVTTVLGVVAAVRAETNALRWTIGQVTLHGLVWQTLAFVAAGWLVHGFGPRARRVLVGLILLAVLAPLVAAAVLGGFGLPVTASTLSLVPSPSQAIFLLGTARNEHPSLLSLGLSLGLPCLLATVLWLALLRRSSPRAASLPADAACQAKNP